MVTKITFKSNGGEECVRLEDKVRTFRDNYRLDGEGELFASFSGKEDIVRIDPSKDASTTKIESHTDNPSGTIKYSTPQEIMINLGNTGYLITYNPK